MRQVVEEDLWLIIRNKAESFSSDDEIPHTCFEINIAQLSKPHRAT